MRGACMRDREFITLGTHAKNLDEQTITLESEDGRSYACRILGVFELDNKQYALLLKQNSQENDENNKPDSSTVIMELVEKDDQAIFRTIENDEEFEHVVGYVKRLATEMSDEEGAKDEATRGKRKKDDE
jgi:uncharacterized protein YrzB (UPF0473 family)